MRIPIGTHLVHPVHGPTILVDVTTRTIGGVPEDYAVFEQLEQDLILQLPMARLEEHGLRPAMDQNAAQEVLAVFDEPATGQGLTWRRMRVRNETKLSSGDPAQVAEVIRDLAAKRTEKGISSSERTMLRAARRRLEVELDLAVAEDAHSLVDGLLGV